jgi:hypothetical protein
VCPSGFAVRLCLNFIAKAVLEELAFLLAIPRLFWLKLAKQKRQLSHNHSLGWPTSGFSLLKVL